MAEDSKVESKLENESAKINESPETTVEPVDQILQQVEKWKNDYLYLRAEFETYKRNAIKERSEISKYGSERLINEILSVTDNFDRALNIKLTNENFEVYAQGVKMAAAELKSLLSKFNVTELKCEGVPFDPNLHEALGSEESETVPEGHILKVFRPAYRLYERIIRPAQVIVAKSKTKAN